LYKAVLPILGAAAMSLAGLFEIWRRSRENPPPRVRRDLRADTVDGGQKGRRGGAVKNELRNISIF